MAAYRRLCLRSVVLALLYFGFQTEAGIQESLQYAEVDTVHMIFMTHLDVGYNGGTETGFINNILNTYFHEYFPRAINLSQQLRTDEYVEGFVYTTHPWLVSLFLDCPHNLVLNNITLKCPNETSVELFKAAVNRGDITWHAGPMNMQFENMNEILFQLSLNISSDLDAMFKIQRKFPTLSQRDVPGMTQAVIPSLVQKGIMAVSVGVNPGTSPPAVPKLFTWEFEDSAVLATWHAGGYPLGPGSSPAKPGGLSRNDCVTVEGFNHAMCYAFIQDNGGPPKDIQEILNYYEIMRKEFPGAKIKASTFDEFFEAVQPIKSQLPVVTKEIGDTWIQGIASDPKKMAKYRAFTSSLSSCFLTHQCDYSDSRIRDAVRFIIKPPEHTWGLPGVGDSVNWTNPLFLKARQGKNFHNCEDAWEEQRQFIDIALEKVKGHPLANIAHYEMEQLTPKEPDLTDYDVVEDAAQIFSCEDGVQIQFSNSGAIKRLYDPYNKIDWASGPDTFGEIRYYTYNETDFSNMASQYNYYGGAGYDKPNSTKNAHPESRQWSTLLTTVYKSRKSAPACDILLKIEMAESAATDRYGAPPMFWLNYVSRKRAHNYGGFDVTLQWFKKPPTRLAEAIMYHFAPHSPGGATSDPEFMWHVSKVGHLVDPSNVVLNGSQYVHAVDNGVYFTQFHGDGLQIHTFDVPVVSIATKMHPPSPFPVPLKPIFQSDMTGVSFNLYNNIWNTNYIMWYPYLPEDQDFKARFQLKLYCAWGCSTAQVQQVG
ncbi:uncharacterized protein LOC110442470 [Mizuhopecten yessoensis]|uniref:uncharacterized protein LOC110442470 n=1 Tax=Mizuhopecten yessoensis TaxID=6573 RepID=UPI000B45DC27|nr:uncharacterized protein LOC110442470 [Mizuhopecten yessoensis]